MWAVSPVPATVFLSYATPTTPLFRPFLQTLSRAAPPKSDGVSDEDIGGFGRTLLANLNSGTSNNSPILKRKKKKQADEKQQQLSGSDVLWALQRAAATKKRRNKRRREVTSPAETHTEEDDDVDYSDVNPLCIKTEWAAKLDDLEKRLQELSQFS